MDTIIVVEDCNVDQPIQLDKILKKFAICHNDNDICKANQLFDSPVYTRNQDIVTAALNNTSKQIL